VGQLPHPAITIIRNRYRRQRGSEATTQGCLESANSRHLLAGEQIDDPTRAKSAAKLNGAIMRCRNCANSSRPDGGGVRTHGFQRAIGRRRQNERYQPAFVGDLERVEAMESPDAGTLTHNQAVVRASIEH
jgi:hypothetical protein